MQIGPTYIQIEEKQKFPTGADILLNWDMVKDLNLSIGKKITLSFGSRRTSIRIGTHSASKSILLIRRSLAQYLTIPFNCSVYVHHDVEANELRLGPLLGILVSKANFSLAEPFDSYTLFVQEAFEAAQSCHAFCYVTTLDHIQLKENQVRGWIFKNGVWKEYLLPLPNVFYNRLSNRLQERSGKDYEVLQTIKDSGVALFNERFLDKWDVYQILSITNVNRYLPTTIQYSNPKSLIRMLKSHAIVYLKPIHGSEGRGIMRVLRSSQGYTLDQTTVNGYQRNQYKNAKELVKYLTPKLRKKSYLIQQGIQLVEWQGAKIDFRALLQKNRSGQWKVLSLLARLGNPNTFVSNLAQGGKLEGAVSLMKQLKGAYSSLPSVKEMKAAALEIANSLDSGLEGNYGELGIDLGVDPAGRIWLIEVNSKPSKRNDAVSEDTKRPRPSVLHLYEYVAHLSSFNQIEANTNKSVRPKPKNRG